jgi:hypothetical protein
MRWFRKKQPPPPPKKPWYTNPNIIVPILGVIIFGLIGTVYTSMAEELKQKVDNKTLQLMIEKDRDQINDLKEYNKETQGAIKKNQEAIQQLLIQQAAGVPPPKPTNESRIIERKENKPPLSPSEFKEYLQLSTEERAAFRKLHPSYESLPK